MIAAAKQITAAPDEKLTAEYAAAEEYNRCLLSGGQLSPYSDLLNLSEDGIMGVLEIPKIDVTLPIYHGTDNTTLSKGIGHLYGTSLPVGGKGTHAALSDTAVWRDSECCLIWISLLSVTALLCGY